LKNAPPRFPPTLRCEPPPVYFLHIGKTAGISLRQVLRRNYRRAEVIEMDAPLLSSVTLAELQTGRCYLAHLGLGLHQLVHRGQLPTITILRDPVERAISLIHFRLKQIQEARHVFTPDYRERLQPLLGAGLQARLEDPALIALIKDTQTRDLGIVRDFRPYLKDGEIGSSGAPILRPLIAPALSEECDMNQVLHRAQQELARMVVVGITEQFDASVEMVCRWLGIPTPARAPQANIGPRKSGVELRGYRATTPPALIERIEELTRYDRELYACACDLFDRQWARHKAGPRRCYSVAPRLRLNGRRGMKAVWSRVRRALPELDNNAAVRRIKRRVKGWLL
jgi:hypothetical protein